MAMIKVREKSGFLMPLGGVGPLGSPFSLLFFFLMIFSMLFIIAKSSVQKVG